MCYNKITPRNNRNVENGYMGKNIRFTINDRTTSL